jgi:hypothetical protein
MPRPLLLLVLLIGVLAGCQDPYQQDPPHDRHSPARAKPALPETPDGDNVSSGAPARDSAPAIEAVARATPRSAVKVFCSQWTNWSWRTIGRQQRRLAALATGPLAHQLAAEAQARTQDQALRRDRLGARGHVVALDIKPGAARRRAICVAWTQPLANGRANQIDARNHVHLATVTRIGDGWAVSQWQPQP